MTCPVCGASGTQPVVEVSDMPALCNAFAATSEAARSMPRGGIDLQVCATCGMLYNVSFDATLAPYDGDYENSLHFSERFLRFAVELATDLGQRFGDPAGTVVEVGSGAGDFLGLVASGFGAAIGIDPSLSAPSEREVQGTTVRLLPGVIDDLPAGVRADLLVCRHVLEHVLQPVTLLRQMRERLAHGSTQLYVEVPDARHMLRAGAVWDLIYEHVGYFTEPALVAALSSAGWRGITTGTSFGGQYLWAEASAEGDAPDGSQRADVEAVVEEARRFGDVYRATVAQWSSFVQQQREQQARVAIWGAGSKGVAFMNAVAPDVEAIDVNPRKRGRHVPGTGTPVSAPVDLAGQVDTVLVMNGLYLDEIERTGADAGLRARYLVVDR